jgi:hypothetical protein
LLLIYFSWGVLSRRRLLLIYFSWGVLSRRRLLLIYFSWGVLSRRQQSFRFCIHVLVLGRRLFIVGISVDLLYRRVGLVLHLELMLN